jgi:hypothetical protein
MMHLCIPHSHFKNFIGCSKKIVVTFLYSSGLSYSEHDAPLHATFALFKNFIGCSKKIGAIFLLTSGV